MINMIVVIKNQDHNYAKLGPEKKTNQTNHFMIKSNCDLKIVKLLWLIVRVKHNKNQQNDLTTP